MKLYNNVKHTDRKFKCMGFQTARREGNYERLMLVKQGLLLLFSLTLRSQVYVFDSQRPDRTKKSMGL